MNQSKHHTVDCRNTEGSHLPGIGKSEIVIEVRNQKDQGKVREFHFRSANAEKTEHSLKLTS